jgi:hypothetical protein
MPSDTSCTSGRPGTVISLARLLIGLSFRRPNLAASRGVAPETNVLSEVWLEALANHLGPDVNQVYATAHDRINQARAQQAEAVPVSPGAGPRSPGVRPGA